MMQHIKWTYSTSCICKTEHVLHADDVWLVPGWKSRKQTNKKSLISKVVKKVTNCTGSGCYRQLVDAGLICVSWAQAPNVSGGTKESTANLRPSSDLSPTSQAQGALIIPFVQELKWEKSGTHCCANIDIDIAKSTHVINGRCTGSQNPWQLLKFKKIYFAILAHC